MRAFSPAGYRKRKYTGAGSRILCYNKMKFNGSRENGGTGSKYGKERSRFLMKRFANRMNLFGESVFTKMAIARQKKIEEGMEVIDLSIGTPNIPPTEKIRRIIAEEAMKPENYIYAIRDKKELLEAAASWYQRRYGVTLDPQTQICSLLGSQEGLSHIAMSIVDPGDLVLVPDPCYPIFADGPKLAGAELYYMPQKKENGYLIRLDEIPEEIARRAKFMVVSYPNNPTTVMAPDSWYHELIAFAKKYEIMVLHDNAYSELVFDGRHCGSFLEYPGAMDVGVEFNSLSKTYGMAGARIGFCVGNPEMVAELKLLKSNIDFGIFLPVQIAAIEAILGDQSCVAETAKAYEQRRDVLCEGLDRIGWHFRKPEATMFVWAPIPEGFADSETFTMELLDRTGVVVTPGSAFGPSGEGHVRMALVQDEDVLLKAITAIEKSGIFA